MCVHTKCFEELFSLKSDLLICVKQLTSVKSAKAHGKQNGPRWNCGRTAMTGQPRNFQLANVLLSDAKCAAFRWQTCCFQRATAQLLDANRTAFRRQPHSFPRQKAMLLKRHGATAAKGLHFRLIPKRV